MEFYRSLGFKVIDGGHMNVGYLDTEETKWRVLENGSTRIGLFQGMYADNMLTFHPEDIHSIKKQLRAAGLPMMHMQDMEVESARYILLQDPDGNIIMIDAM